MEYEPKTREQAIFPDAKVCKVKFQACRDNNRNEIFVGQFQSMGAWIKWINHPDQSNLYVLQVLIRYEYD